MLPFLFTHIIDRSVHDNISNMDIYILQYVIVIVKMFFVVVWGIFSSKLQSENNYESI